jgi:8-oxo-dGTP diphosphatase
VTPELKTSPPSRLRYTAFPGGTFLQKVSLKKEVFRSMAPGREISAGGVVFRPVDGVIEVALISVKDGKVWGFPKGRVEKGENLALTAHREVREETGLNGKILEKLGQVEYFFTFKDEGKFTKIFKIVYFFLMEYTGGDVRDHDDEVVDCRWFPVDTAMGLLKYDDEKGLLEKAMGVLKSRKYI